MTTSPIGTDVDRIDGRLKVTGAADYAADHTTTDIPGLCHGYLVTSTIARGTITAMDTDAATSAPGVLAVYTPFNPLQLFAYGGAQNDETNVPLQDASVRYRGQAIGLVVAETFEQARDAAALIETDYAPQPPATSFAAGLPSAAVVPDAAVAEVVLAPGVPSIDAALAASPVTVSASYTSSIVHHMAMEPHATVAFWTGDHVTVYTVTQGVALVVSRLSHTLGVDAAKIHVVNPYVGGAFGGKWGNWAQTPLTAAAAKVLGRPVKTVLTREQVFTVVGHRPATSQTVTLGAASDGTLSALQHDGISEKSASNSFSEGVAGYSQTIYASPNIKVANKTVTLDTPVTTIMRAPGEANGSFGLESAIDELAAELGLDPLEVRQRNYAATVPGNGEPWSSKHLDECYSRGAELFGWAGRAPATRATTDGDWLVGLGMATAAYPASRGASTIKVRFQSDGTAVVSGAGSDAGTGQSTVFAIIGADSLGLPVDRVRAELGDSALVAAVNAGGSSSTASNGTAVQLAAQAAISALIQFAVTTSGSPFYGLAASDVAYQQGVLSSGSTSLPFGKVLTRLNTAGVEATATAPKNTVKNHGFMSFGAHFCEVRVHRLTGEPRVSRLLTVIDAGTLVNHKAARSQIMGGLIMGLGHALLEGTRLEPDTGRFANGNFADYLVPVNADVPVIDVEFLNYPDTLFNPLGMRGIGELGIVGVAGAVANAVYHATGIRVRDLPITLDKLLG